MQVYLVRDSQGNYPKRIYEGIKDFGCVGANWVYVAEKRPSVGDRNLSVAEDRMAKIKRQCVAIGYNMEFEMCRVEESKWLKLYMKGEKGLVIKYIPAS